MMRRIEHTIGPAMPCLEMDLQLATHAALQQLPALATRRLRRHLDEIALLQALAHDNEGALRLARKLFGLLANASVHQGEAGTLRPLLAQLSLLRTYLWLRRHVSVQVPEPLQRGTPDLIAHVDGEEIWIDIRARAPDVLAERPRARLLLVDRTTSGRREPPLRLGRGYAGEFHLLRSDRARCEGTGLHTLEQQQPAVDDSRTDRIVAVLARATRACPPPVADTRHEREHRA